MKRYALVTGGAGFIGTNVVEKFIKEGYDVISLDNLQRNGVQDNLNYLKSTYKDKFHFVWGDIRKPQDFRPIKSNYDNIVCILHLAGQPGIPRSIQDPIYDFEVNALGTLHVLEFARGLGNIPVMFASTNKVYSDKINQIPLAELDKRYEHSGNLTPPSSLHAYGKYLGNPESFPVDGGGDGLCHSPYGCSKLTADQYVQEYYAIFGVPTVVNRMSCIGGLHQCGVEDQGWLDHFVRTIFKGDGNLYIYGNGKQVRDVLDGRDVADLYFEEFRQIETCKGKVFNVGGGMENNTSLLECIDIIEKLTGKKANLTHKDWRDADHRYYVSDISKVYSVLGWKPKIFLEQSIKDMIEQYSHILVGKKFLREIY